jgi:hypothetical protein
MVEYCKVPCGRSFPHRSGESSSDLERERKILIIDPYAPNGAADCTRPEMQRWYLVVRTVGLMCAVGRVYVQRPRLRKTFWRNSIRTLPLDVKPSVLRFRILGPVFWGDGKRAGILYLVYS